MVDVEIFLRFIVDVDLELGNLVFCFSGYEEIIRGIDFEFFAFIIIFLERGVLRREKALKIASTYIFQSNKRIFGIVFVIS